MQQSQSAKQFEKSAHVNRLNPQRPIRRNTAEKKIRRSKVSDAADYKPYKHNCQCEFFVCHTCANLIFNEQVQQATAIHLHGQTHAVHCRSVPRIHRQWRQETIDSRDLGLNCMCVRIAAGQAFRAPLQGQRQPVSLLLRPELWG